MILILAILAATRASPIGLQPPPLVSLDQLHVPRSSCDDPNGCRSLGDIIRSCIITIFLCTWVSIHPNIPSPDEGWLKVAWRRAGLMLLALLLPEGVIAWALRQRLAAAELAKEHKGEGWTITHGFFAIMGGFMAYEGNRPIRVLLPDQLKSYSLTGNGDFPRISKAEIEDRSKGDAISKAVVVLQTGWFVTQCIARGVQGLPITELELVTVAFATLNLVIYVLWWDKPLNVQRGVRVYKKRIAEEHIDDGEVEATIGFWDAIGNTLSDIPGSIVRGPLTSLSTDMWLLRVFLWPILMPVYSLLGDDDSDDLEKRVNTFYPTNWVAASKNRSTFLVAIITLAFGGIHCIGWSFTFPSSTEQTFWRVASLSITSLPIVIVALGVFGGAPDGFFSALTMILLLLLYILGRVVLLVLPLLSFRSLPPAAFHVVQWTSFIPHV